MEASKKYWLSLCHFNYQRSSTDEHRSYTADSDGHNSLIIARDEMKMKYMAWKKKDDDNDERFMLTSVSSPHHIPLTSHMHQDTGHLSVIGCSDLANYPQRPENKWDNINWAWRLHRGWSGLDSFEKRKFLLERP